MLSLHRILKYSPAVVLGLLIAAWVVSWFGLFQLVAPSSPGRIVGANLLNGSLILFADAGPEDWSSRWTSHLGDGPLRSKMLGRFGGYVNPMPGRIRLVQMPLPVVITLAMPFAIGPFPSFRFRLWHYLAYTTVVAVELAYYLRWQE